MGVNIIVNKTSSKRKLSILIEQKPEVCGIRMEKCRRSSSFSQDRIVFVDNRSGKLYSLWSKRCTISLNKNASTNLSSGIHTEQKIKSGDENSFVLNTSVFEKKGCLSSVIKARLVLYLFLSFHQARRWNVKTRRNMKSPSADDSAVCCS